MKVVAEIYRLRNSKETLKAQRERRRLESTYTYLCYVFYASLCFMLYFAILFYSVILCYIRVWMLGGSGIHYSLKN